MKLSSKRSVTFSLEEVLEILIEHCEGGIFNPPMREDKLTTTVSEDGKFFTIIDDNPD